jgi:hypothetical protein
MEALKLLFASTPLPVVVNLAELISEFIYV